MSADFGAVYSEVGGMIEFFFVTLTCEAYVASMPGISLTMGGMSNLLGLVFCCSALQSGQGPDEQRMCCRSCA